MAKYDVKLEVYNSGADYEVEAGVNDELKVWIGINEYSSLVFERETWDRLVKNINKIFNLPKNKEKE